MPAHGDLESILDAAARAIQRATALVVTAGAGMGVDSGLPDFRGSEGFWQAYPPYRALGLRFEDLANPQWFERDPELAWGFYGHRLGLYRATVPHPGFDVLVQWMRKRRDGGFVFTSNVDGQFQRARFDPERIVECHGAIDALQCTRSCGAEITSADRVEVAVDPRTFRAAPPLPTCAACGRLARPNVLMFGDAEWDSARTDAQSRRLDTWLARATARPDAHIVVIECGAGTAIPTVRLFGERLVARSGGTLVRVNLREWAVPSGQLGVATGALAALRATAARVDP